MKSLKLLLLIPAFILYSVGSYTQSIFKVIKEDNYEKLEQLLEKKPDLVDTLDGRHHTPLHIAAILDHPDMVKLLLEKGANVNALNQDERNPLIFANAGHSLESARILVEEGVDIRAKDNFERTPLHWVAIEGDTAMAKFLIKKGVNIHATDDQLKTPLHWAAVRNKTGVARVLIENGAQVNTIDDHARSPLFIASWNGNMELVKILIKNKAVVDARYLGAASPLTTAAVADHDDICKYLVENNANVDLFCNMQITPVYFAIYNNNIDMVNYYLDKKAKINYQDFVGRSPLYVAVRDGYTEIAKTLIDYGANPYFVEKSKGRNLLHIAASNGRKEIAGILLKNGLEINDTDKDGLTPMDYARKHKHPTVVEFLQTQKGINNKHKKNKANNLDIQNEKEAYIVKLRNKTWGVRTKSGFITFDYHETGTLPPNPSVFNGCINPDEWKEVPFYHIDGGFSSNKTLYEKENEFDSIHFIFNYRYQGHYNRTKPFELTNLYFPEENNSTSIQKIKVTPLPGYRQSQKSYFIEADGLNILWLYRHSARYQPWRKNTEAIKYLKNNNKQIDLMFVGNPNTDNGPEWMSIMEEAYEMSKDLEINAVFPIPTCKMGEYFCNERKRKGDGENIYYAINPGDFFFYKENQIKK